MSRQNNEKVIKTKRKCKYRMFISYQNRIRQRIRHAVGVTSYNVVVFIKSIFYIGLNSIYYKSININNLNYPIYLYSIILI